MATYHIATVLALSLVQQVLAGPIQSSITCENPRVRKEWRSQTDAEKKEYIRAVKCLFDSPPKLKEYVENVHNRYDDFVAMHLNTTLGGTDLNGHIGGTIEPLMTMGEGETSHVMENHNPEQVLPWHRWAIQVYENVLKEECGFTGTHPYWDYHLDTFEGEGDFMHSPLWDAETGFGGNGAFIPHLYTPEELATMPDLTRETPWNFPGEAPPEFPGGTGGGCVVDGAFKDVVLNIGPMGRMLGDTPRCLTRNFNPGHLNGGATREAYARLLTKTDYIEFGTQMMAWNYLSADGIMEMDFHVTGHGSIGGEMNDPMNSVNDPMFFMHHAAMDRLWALWQEQDVKRIQDAPQTEMWIGPLEPNRRRIDEVYDTQNRDGKGILCYKYEGKPFEYYISGGSKLAFDQKRV